MTKSMQEAKAKRIKQVAGFWASIKNFISTPHFMEPVDEGESNQKDDGISVPM